MPKATWSQQNFNGGEWSPLMYGRVGIEKYKTSLALCSNFIPQIQGGLTRRPGTRFVTEVKDSTQAVRLVRFEFSITQAYVLEFGNNYIRFCANDGQVLNAGGTAKWNSKTSQPKCCAYPQKPPYPCWSCPMARCWNKAWTSCAGP